MSAPHNAYHPGGLQVTKSAPYRGDGVSTTSTQSQYGDDRRADAPLPRRTLTDVHNQVAHEMAVRAITKAEVVDGCKIGVILSMGDQSSEAAFLRLVADHMAAEMRLRLGRVGAGWLFILADGSPHPPPDLTASVSTGKGSKPPPNVIFILGATEELVQRGALLTCSKFVGRVVSTSDMNPALRISTHSSSTQDPDFSDFLGLDERTFWTGLVRNLGDSIYDEAALWDVVRKAARKPIDPLLPPPGSVSIDQMLAGARAKLQRVTPNQAYRELQANGDARELPLGGSASQSGVSLTTATHTTAALGAPVILVDIRPQAQREKHGGIKGALCIERNVLEWRLDPRSDARLPVADRYDLVVIVVCQEGYTSSLAAYSLQQLGLLNATDIIGGYEAWRLAGLPVDTPEEVILASQGRDQRSLASRAGSVV